MSLVASWLTRWKGSPFAERSALRGSQLTALWVPGRPAYDVDFLLLDEWMPRELAERLKALAARGDGGGPFEARSEVIFGETENPGVRLRIARGGERLQVDVGWGDPLAAPSRPAIVHGVELPGVVPEVMFGWKVHGLVEFGRGRWDPKTLADVALLHRHVRLGRALARAAIEIALRSRGMTLAALDELLGDPTWGRSNSSRKKWRSFRRRAPWADFEIEEAVEVARSAVGYYLEG